MNIKNYPFANKVVKFVVKETCDSAIENGFEYAVGKTVSIKLTEISDDNIYGVFTTGKLKGTKTCLAYGGNGLGLWVDGCENYDLDVFLTAETAKAESIEEFLKIGFQCLLQQRLDDFEEEVETWFEDGFHGAWY